MRPLKMSSFYGLKLLVISLLDNKNEAEIQPHFYGFGLSHPSVVAESLHPL